MRIVFVAPPFAGHLYPLLPLARAARDAGHAVEVVTGARKRAVLESHGFEVRVLASAGVDRLEAIANTTTRVGSHPLRLLAQLRENLALMPPVEQELVDAWRATRPDLVVADSVAVVAGLAAVDLGIPWITTIATPFAIENRRGVPAYCGGWAPRPNVWGRARDAAGRFAGRAFKRSVGWWFRRELARLGLAALYRPDGTETVYSPTAILGFGIQELELERDWPAAFRMIGPVVEAPETCPELALPPRPRVLVTLGTHLLWAKERFVADVVRVAAELPGVELVVSMGNAEEAGGPLVRVGPGVSACPFVPYARDLAAFDAVVHHGGAGITYAAVLAGVPSLVVPHDYDQFDFAARVEHHRLGLRAAKLTAPALRSVLERDSWPALTRMQAAARRYRPVESFLDAVAAAVPARR